MRDENRVQHAKDEIDRTVGLFLSMMAWIWAKPNHMQASEIFDKIHFGVPELEKGVGNREHFAMMLQFKKPPNRESSEKDIIYWMFIVIISLRYLFDRAIYSSEEYGEIKAYLESKAKVQDKTGYLYMLVRDEIAEFLNPHTSSESRSNGSGSFRPSSQGQKGSGSGCMTVIVGAFFFGAILLIW